MKSAKVFSKSGQPRMGAVLYLPMQDGGEPLPVTVVSKGWGHGGYADLIMVTLEDEATGARETFNWPIRRGNGSFVAFSEDGHALPEVRSCK